MAFGSFTVPVLPRVDRRVGRLLPVLTTITAALIALLPFRVPGYAALTPALSLMAVYHWTIYRPDLLPSIALFAIGIGADLLAGAPVGVSALALLLVRGAVLRVRRHFINRTFPFVWTGFTIAAIGVLLGLWALECLLQMRLFDPRSTVFRLVLTIAAFPVASFLLGRTQRAFVGAA